jgi:hypothetical protein
MGNYLKKMSRKVRDDTLSFDLPGSNIILTRYLYFKDEVKLALLVSILNKTDDAIFWAYELYYSGFKLELYEYIWKIYYDFFATLNPSFEQYLYKTLKDPNDWIINPKLVSTIIQDLIIRPFNTDIFFLKTICSIFEIPCNHIVNSKIDIYRLHKTTSNFYEQLTAWFDANDFRSLAQYILNMVSFDFETETSDADLYKIYYHTIDIFTNIYGIKLLKSKLLKEFTISQDRINNQLTNAKEMINIKKLVLLVKILTLVSIKEKLIKGKNFYIVVEPDEIKQYDTIEMSFTNINTKHYRILRDARIHGIDDLKHLSLFKLERNKIKSEEIKEIYWINWLYHASFSPIWFNCIKQHRGYVDYQKQSVEFIDNDLLEMFYKKYGYEPDEQSQEITDKSLHINTDSNINWTNFHNKYNKNNLFMLDDDELDEINNDKIKY